MDNTMRKYSMAFIDENEYSEIWKNIPEFSDYMISNHKRLYKKSTTEYFYKPKINKLIQLTKNNGEKVQKTILKLIKDAFQIKYDYIYVNENFYIIPTLTNYGISNYNRVINYTYGHILKLIEDNNTLFINQLWYDNGQRCCNVSLQQLWNKFHETLDCIDVNNEMDYTCEKEFYRIIPDFPNYRVSNYANIKNDEYNTYVLPIKNGKYYQVGLRYNTKPYTKFLHKIVIQVFKGNASSNKQTVEP